MLEYDLAILRRTGHVDYFVEMVEAVEKGEAFTITKDGKPVAVVISPDALAELESVYVGEQLRRGNYTVIES